MRSPRRKAPSVPASLQRSASASNRRFSLPENWRRLAIATTSGSRRAAASEAVSPVALRAPSATASEEEPNDPFIEDFSNEVMCMSYLYSKLPETGVSPHIGTGGSDKELARLKDGGIRGIRVNLVDRGGNPFASLDALSGIAERIRDLGFHIELLVHVESFPELRSLAKSVCVPLSVGHIGYTKVAAGGLN